MRFVKFEFVMLILGVCVGIGLFVLSTIFSQWTYIAKIPETPAKLFYRYTDRTIFVKTTDELIFSCQWIAQICALIDEEVDFEADEFKLPFGKPPKTGLMPFPPGNIATSVFAIDPGIEWSNIRYVIALDDGTLWEWGVDPFSDLSVYVCGGFSGIAAVSWGIPLYLFLWSFSLRSRRKIKNEEKPS